MSDGTGFDDVLGGVGFYQVSTWDGSTYVVPTVVEAGRGYWVLVLEDIIIEI